MALVSSPSDPNKVSIIPTSELREVDENCINEANKPLKSAEESRNAQKKAKSPSIEEPLQEPFCQNQLTQEQTLLCQNQLSPNSENELPEKEEYNIELKKDNNGLGITIAGYVCEKGNHMSF